MDVRKEYEECGKSGCVKRPPKNQRYCSRDHAPYGHYGDASRSEKKTGISFMPARGDPCRGFNYVEKKVANGILLVRKNRTIEKNQKPVREKTIGRISKEIVNPPGNGGTLSAPKQKEPTEQKPMNENPKIGISTEPTGENTMPTIENPRCEPSTRQETGVILVEESTQPYENLKRAKSESMKLIDESASHLRDLMKSVRFKIRLKDGEEIPDTHGIQVACNCASQIHKLIRLKLDIIKTAKS